MWPLFCSVQVYISLYFLPLWICNFPLSLFNPLFCQAFYTILFNLTNLCFWICFYSQVHFLSSSMNISSDDLLVSLLSRCSVLMNYVMQSNNIFSVSSCFLSFSGLSFLATRFFRVQVQGLGPYFRSTPTLVYIFSYVEEENMWK